MTEIKLPVGRYCLSKKVVATADDETNNGFILKTGCVYPIVVELQVLDSNGAEVIPDYKMEIINDTDTYGETIIKITKRSGGPNVVEGYSFNFLGVRKYEV